MKIFKSIWKNRGFVFATITRDFHAKYKNSIIGAGWAIINPLSMILVYTLIFGNIMKARLPGDNGIYSYSIYLFSGQLVWILFSEIILRGTNMFIENATLIKKISFTKICIPISVAITAMINYFIIYGLFIFFLILIDKFKIEMFLWVLPLTIILVVFSTGVAIILGLLNVFFRDVGQLAGIIISFLYWLTPIVYPLSILDGDLKDLVYLNPISYFVLTYHDVLFYDTDVSLMRLLVLTTFSIVSITLAALFYRRHISEIVDEL